MHNKDYKVTTYTTENSRTVLKTDSVVDSIVDKFIDRATFGQKKYSKTLDREDLGLYDWCEHAIQEAMDMILYLRKVQKMIDPNRK